MPIAHTMETMNAYWSGHDPEAVAPDAVFTDMATGRQWRGRDEIAGMLRFMYEEAFEADFHPNHAHFAERSAAVEGRFVGRHVGAFAGVEATGKEVDVPLAVFYTVEERGITEGRVWFMLASFLEQVA